MLIEIKSSPTSPNNEPQKMLQLFKETLILKPRTRIALVNALINTHTDFYSNLEGGASWLGSNGTTYVFDNTGASGYWKFRLDSTGGTNYDRWFQPLSNGEWVIYNTEPTTGLEPVSSTAEIDINSGKLSFSNGLFMIPQFYPNRVYIEAGVKQGSETILINIDNFPINSRNASGNTDNHIATIPILGNLNDASNSVQFYEPYNANFHRLDNEADLNLNHIEISLTNADGTPRTDLRHPIQLTLLLTPDYN